jgi:hypothetical protein
MIKFRIKTDYENTNSFIIPEQYILAKSSIVNLENQNPFKNAEEESKKIEQFEKEKREKLENFKKTVHDRVIAYKNAKRMLNEDRDIKIKNQVNEEFFEEKTKNNNKNLKKQTINDVKIKLASKINLKRDQFGISTDCNINNEDEIKKTDLNFKSVIDSETLYLTKLSPFGLKSLILDAQNVTKTCQEKNKRISITRKMFADLEREKAKNYLNKSDDVQYITELKTKNEKARFNEESELDNLNKNFTISIQNDHSDYLNMQIKNTKKKIYTKTFDKHSFKEITRPNEIQLPLCKCKSYETHNMDPNECCANNCTFYQNQKGNMLITFHFIHGLTT